MTVYLPYIFSRYNELYKQAGGNQGRIIDREKFSEYFNLPVALGDRLFEAFDRKQVNLSNMYNTHWKKLCYLHVQWTMDYFRQLRYVYGTVLFDLNHELFDYDLNPPLTQPILFDMIS